MLTTLKNSGRYHEVLFMAILSVTCFVFSVFRVAYTKSTLYLFLDWNLFLAFIPWALTTWLALSPRLEERKISLGLLLMTWFVFFPNAPYIITDLFHLQHTSAMPIWYDTVQIVAFAWTGLLFGFLSLREIELLNRKRWGNRMAILVIVGLLFVSGFGIYIGRFLRWNSWDLINHPLHLLGDITERMVHPLQHTRTWGVTVFMGILLNMIYWSLRFFRSPEKRFASPEHHNFSTENVKD